LICSPALLQGLFLSDAGLSLFNRIITYIYAKDLLGIEMKQKALGVEFDKFEKMALGEVMATSRNILESFKFSMIFHSRVAPELQETTRKRLGDYRKAHGIKKAADYESYVKGY